MQTPFAFPFETFQRAFTSLAELHAKLRVTLTPHEAETVEAVLRMVIQAVKDDVQAAMTTSSDHAFGQGYREGRAAGETTGWTKRDGLAQEERAALERQIAEQRPYVQAYQAMLRAQTPAPAETADATADPLLDALEQQIAAGTVRTH